MGRASPQLVVGAAAAGDGVHTIERQRESLFS